MVSHLLQIVLPFGLKLLPHMFHAERIWSSSQLLIWVYQFPTQAGITGLPKQNGSVLLSLKLIVFVQAL